MAGNSLEQILSGLRAPTKIKSAKKIVIFRIYVLKALQWYIVPCVFLFFKVACVGRFPENFCIGDEC